MKNILLKAAPKITSIYFAEDAETNAIEWAVELGDDESDSVYVLVDQTRCYLIGKRKSKDSDGYKYRW
jgi:hypothetical protein